MASPLTPEREKLLQRVFQFLTALCVLIIVFVVVNAFVGKPFASVIQNENEETQKKVRNVRKEAVGFTAATLGSVLNSDLDQVIAENREIAAKNPNDVNAYLEIAKAAFQKKDYSTASENFHMAASLEPANEEIFEAYIRSLLRQRKALEAKQALSESKFDSPKIELLRAIVFAYLNEPDSAKEIFNALEKEFPDMASPFKPLKKAYQEFDDAADGKPEYLQTLLAKAFDELGEYELALSLALDAVKTKNDYRDAWIIAGHAALGAEKYQEALQALQKALALDQSSGEAHLYLAYVFQSQGNFTEAASHFEQAKTLGKEIPEDIQETFIAQSVQKNEFEDALVIEEQKLAERKGVALPNEYIHAVHLAIDKVKKPERALPLAEQAYQDHPQDPMAVNLMGWAYLGLGDIRQSENYLKAALSLDPTLEAAYYNYGKLYEALGKYENALANFEKSVQFAREHGNISIENAAQTRLNLLKDSLATLE